ncbi:hypothetical protein B0A54_17938 [Friedmanniomyces endolithicus]|uniref:Uncharacterized protein n=1 Tax=Friedmanniomyces endolithicus TaxID=329885 RepID=A0A4U0TP98_9PEZI|nr:hypothetical protein LTS09_018048 [Friedmanniomyces endolithicus]TKA23891.1 hypothetical protein B0A54_17938 [Friedmanniomyces endolithicus]
MSSTADILSAPATTSSTAPVPDGADRDSFSTGAKAGIGVGAAVGAIIVITFAVLVAPRWSAKRRQTPTKTWINFRLGHDTEPKAELSTQAAILEFPQETARQHEPMAEISSKVAVSEMSNEAAKVELWAYSELVELG